MDINDLERKTMSTEWDGGWFCDKCEGWIHWKTKAYMINGSPYCEECAEKILKSEK